MFFSRAPLSRSRAQTLKGTILGTITDSSRAVIPSAQVLLTEVGTNFRRTEITNDSGFYVFANLDPGNYKVEVEHPGFRKVIHADIGLVPNTTVRVDLELSPGEVSEVVNVMAEATLLQTDRSDTGGKIQTGQLQTLPLLYNRNYQGLLMLVPGVGRPYRSNSEFYNSQDHLQSVVNGRNQNNNYMVEGIDNNVENLTGIIPPPEAIAAVDVTTSNYDPELGRAGGAVVNVTLRSGTNNFHGSAFEYHYDNDIQARNVFATTKPLNIYNQFGGTFGGRIKRDRLFFFSDYQGNRARRGTSELPTIPTLAFRDGDLSASPTTIYDPATGSPDGRGRQPFPGNQIPATRISPIARRILSFIPPPTRPGLTTNFEKGTVESKLMDQFDAKLDYVIGSSDRMFFRYSYQRAVVFDPGLYGPNDGIYGGPHNGGFEGRGPARNQSPGINYSHIFSPTLVTEVRFGIVRNRNDAINIDRGLSTSRDIGIPGANLDLWSSGLSAINIDGYNTPLVGFSPSLPWARSVTNFDWVNNWTKTAGTQVIKWGFDIRRERQDLLQTQTFNPRGLFRFNAGTSALNGDRNTSFANSFAAFLLDQPNQIGRDLTVFFPARRNTIYNLYLQDKWQVTQKVTLDLGLRWEYWPSSTPHFPAGFSDYNPENNTLELAGVGQIPNDLGIESQPKSFAPRFGIAYRLNDKTVLRGGYGISYLPRDTNVYNFPVKQANSLDAPNSFIAAGSMAKGFPPPTPVQIPRDGIIRNPPAQQYDVVPKNLFHSYVGSWNVAVQRSLPKDLSVEAAYVANHGVNIGQTLNLNAGRVPGAGSAGQPLFQRFGRLAASNSTTGTHSYYDSLQVKLDRRFSGGLMLTTAYSFSKAIDFDSGNQVYFFLNRGRASFDREHVLVQSFIYELPFGPGKRWAHSGPERWLLGGWQFNGILTAESGMPLNLTFSSATLNAPFNSNRPNLNGEVQIFGAIGPGKRYFDVTKFSAPAPDTFGTAGRNILHGPRLFGLDFSIFRKFPIGERMSLEFHSEAFNLTNTPHFDNPNTTFGSPSFGAVTTARGNQASAVNENRQLQVGLRLWF